MEAAGDKKRVVLVVGGSGYLGLHVLEALAASPCDYTLAYTYQSHPPSPELLQKIPHVLPLPLDLRTGHGLESIFDKLGTVGSFLPPNPTPVKPCSFAVARSLIVLNETKLFMSELVICHLSRVQGFSSLITYVG
jgi:hypothetical protein